VAVFVAYLGFGWPALLVGIPALVGTALVLLAVRLSERPRRRLAQARAARYEAPPVPGGLMSGFFEVPNPRTAPTAPAVTPASPVDHSRA
jgi:hypothetical protein